ncbi:MAG: PVC-type heme-binding CxxCH protein [Planctomycetota bacterium]|nr:PVC-type heme-binding CxxCH protein [Planctomycetota bacterium]
MTRVYLICPVIFLALISCCATVSGEDKPVSVTSQGPLSPQESLRHLKVAPGLRVELVAAEPQIIDPVAIAFDESGRLWVVEMSDYPRGPGPNETPKSRVRILEDRDQDGHFETASTFVDQLLFATGLQLWKGGAFITLAGKVVYFRDTTGDGKADVRETWFSGFAQKNEQLRANHPTLGPDHRIYIANGLRDGTIVGRPAADGTPARPVSISGRDFRFDPITGGYDAVTGSGQFGLTYDNFGNRFVCTNRNATKQIVLQRRYPDRVPLLQVPALTYDVTPAGAEAEVFSLSRNWTAYSDHAGQITAACGVTVYRGSALPAEYLDNIFVCEPPGNLVHRRILEPHGAIFRSRRARSKVEFLASPDDWFRPVNLTIGPDGALYVVDMYRAVVEHPHWIPEEVSQKLPLQAGNDRGRIYRIVQQATAAAGEIAERNRFGPGGLRSSSTVELVQMLSATNAWWRETAARLLYERQDETADKFLRAMLRGGDPATARCHALWSLDGIKRLAPEDVLTAMTDRNPRVREQGVRLSEQWLKDSPAVLRSVIDLATDSDARVRFQVALSLGESGNTAQVITALEQIALHEKTDSWTRLAVLSATGEYAGQMLLKLLQRRDDWVNTPVARELIGDLAHLVGARRKKFEIAQVLATVLEPPSATLLDARQLIVLKELGRGIAWRSGSFAALIAELVDQDGSTGRRLVAVLSRIAAAARNSQTALPLRRDCLEMLRYTGFSHAGEALLEIVQSTASQELRLLAMDVASSYDDPKISRVLMADFGSQTPAVRRAVLDAMLSNRARVRILLGELAAKNIAITELSPTAVQQLTQDPDPAVSGLAKRVLGDMVPANRQQIISEYQAAIAIRGDVQRGRNIFSKNCSECHRIGELGVAVGPYIGDFTQKPNVRNNPSAILESILNPNRAIDANYVSYTIVTTSGKVLTGIVAQETGASVTLEQSKGKRVTVLRREIEVIRSNQTSLMPEGFEKNISLTQMADLVAFLKEWRFLEDLVPLEKRSGSPEGTSR